MKRLSAALQFPTLAVKFMRTLATLAVAFNTGMAIASDARLEIATGSEVRRFTVTELSAHPALREIEIPADVAYQKPMRFRALPLSALIGSLAQSTNVQFVASDGFVANIPGALLTRGQPWLAVEPAAAPWPPLKPGKPSAGPFYLVWTAPEKSGVLPEQWPYKLARISVALPLEQRFPQIRPSRDLRSDGAQQRGLKVYIESCSVCHPLNGGGDAAVGPDLNRPFSPTEYFQDAYLRRLIRDSASVRNWPQRAMPAFAPEALSDANLDDLVAYLKQMAKQR